MIRIRFTDLDAKKRALGRLAGRFPFKSWATARCSSRRRRWASWPPRTSLSRSRALPRMSRSLRRYEILLPLRFNDGQPVPDELVADTLLELEHDSGRYRPRRRASRACGGTRVGPTEEFRVHHTEFLTAEFRVHHTEFLTADRGSKPKETAWRSARASLSAPGTASQRSSPIVQLYFTRPGVRRLRIPES